MAAHMTNAERRIGVAILEGFAPPSADPKAIVPLDGEVDFGETLDLMVDGGNPRARLGTRLAILVVNLAPLYLLMFPRTMASLPHAKRAKVLDRMLASDVFIIRELALLLKLTASFALLGVASVVERSHYYQGRPASLPLGRHLPPDHEHPVKPAPRKLAVLQEVR